MLKLERDQRIEQIENAQGGRGTIEIRHIIEPEDHNNPHLNMVARITIQPGAAVGFHSHEGLTEVIYILDGQALYNDGAERILKPGDAAVVYDQDRQSICCADNRPLTYLAVIALMG
jgi:quercetin dioxygenase-like cupin family protein